MIKMAGASVSPAKLMIICSRLVPFENKKKMSHTKNKTSEAIRNDGIVCSVYPKDEQGDSLFLYSKIKME